MWCSVHSFQTEVVPETGGYRVTTFHMPVNLLIAEIKDSGS
jgi:hypothetical protein